MQQFQLLITATIPPLKVDKAGSIRIGKTRVLLDTVVSAFKTGSTPEEIVMQFPALTLADVYAVISYYLSHRHAVELYLENNRKTANEIKQAFQSKFPTTGIRERLLARHLEKII